MAPTLSTSTCVSGHRLRCKATVVDVLTRSTLCQTEHSVLNGFIKIRRDICFFVKGVNAVRGLRFYEPMAVRFGDYEPVFKQRPRGDAMINAGRYWVAWLGAVLVVLACTQAHPLWGQSDEFEGLTHRELAIRYAKTKVDLAEIDVRRALEMREQNILPGLTLERVRSNLVIAKEQHSQAILSSTDRSTKIRLRHAEERLRLAKLLLESRQRLSDTSRLAALDLKRVELNHELARLNLRMVQNPGEVGSQMEYMQRQIDRFGEDLLWLDERLTRLESRNSLVK